MAGDNEMSDDLERAWKELKAGLGVALGGAPAPGPRTPQSADDWTASPDSGSVDLEALARLVILSFLDMDEAGVERIAKAVWIDAYKDTAISEKRLDELWCRASPEDKLRGGTTMNDALSAARAVLTELRKMAGAEE